MNANSIRHSNPATRQSLLKRVRNLQDEESWQTFFQTYWKLIYHLALRQGLNDADAEEAVQDTMLALARKMPEFEYDPAKGAFRSWLLNQAGWRIRELGRAKRRGAILQPFNKSKAPAPFEDETRTATAHQVPDLRAECNPCIDGDWAESVHAAAVAAVRAQVTPQQYQIFDLYVLRQWPASRVSATLGVRRVRLYMIATRARRLYKTERDRILATAENIDSPCALQPTAL